MSPPLETSSQRASIAVPNEFTSDERRVLLALAHQAILGGFDGKQIDLEAPSPHLAEPRGAFTTIYCQGQLHGCVGYVLAIAPLYRVVADTARSAAFEDTRFPPLTRDQASDLEISLSILSPLQPIKPERIEIGRHGLLISHGAHRGLLLPQVPVEHGWDRTTFLEQTCRKAGLPPDAWQQNASIEAFTAEVFGDSDLE